MEDDFDLSVSPPASPCNLECEGEVNISKPPCFSCLPESGTEGKYFISSDGYIKRGYLKRLLLRLDPSPTDFETDLVELFGFSWVTEMALVESTKVLFGFFRFFDISRITDNQPQHPYEELEVQLPSVLLEELHSIVIYIGCIRDLPNNIQVAFSIQNYGKAGVLEEQLRMYLQCCLTLCRVWDSNLNTVTILWEYYCKNLNSSFAIPWLGIKSLATVSKTPFSLLELVRSCCIDEQSPDLYKTTNSYHFFLRIIALQMRKETNGTHPWKQIKGRIYSKFHQRKMQELSETGLMHFLCLFLLLARTAEVEDVVSRATDLLGTLTKSSIAIANQGLIWKGLFAFLLIYEEKGLDIGALADHLSSSFHQVAKEFYLKTTDHSRKQTLWILLSTYIDGVQEVIENSSHLHLSEEKLLNEGFSMLLPACQMSELNFTLSFLQTVIAQLRCVYKRSAQSLQQICTAAVQNVPLLSVAKERHLAIATVLWKNFFPYLKSLRLSQTPPPQLADTAAGFALLAMDMPSTAPPDLQPQPFQSIMQNFGWDDMINPHLVSRFLRKKYEDQLMEFTRLVFKLPEMETLLMKAKVELFSLKLEIKPALSLFIKVIGKAYNELQNLSEKSAMVSKALEYVGDIFKYMKPYLVNSDPPDSILLLYWTVGCLLKSWAPILATSKAQQLLCSIIDRLLLPGALLQKDKDLPTAKLAAIKENLPQCLQFYSVSDVHVVQQTCIFLSELMIFISILFTRAAMTTVGAVIDACSELFVVLAIKDTVSCDRYQTTIWHLHFDNKNMCENDRFAAISHIWQRFVENFVLSYNSGQTLSESVVIKLMEPFLDRQNHNNRHLLHSDFAS
ncbi:MMS22 protein, partial [Polypterus senegalus]